MDIIVSLPPKNKRLPQNFSQSQLMNEISDVLRADYLSTSLDLDLDLVCATTHQHSRSRVCVCT